MRAVACDLIRTHSSPLTFLSFLFSVIYVFSFFFSCFRAGKKGANFIRVHDVPENKDVVTLSDAVYTRD
jgi:hypothetical protein